uniref:GON-4-like protein isoform X1 n=1 Tax=Styela clava TaxID=7725 RepID=UPI00193A5472|nr:GON-4-like protein isoform X1 [Styela clava]
MDDQAGTSSLQCESNVPDGESKHDGEEDTCNIDNNESSEQHIKETDGSGPNIIDIAVSQNYSFNEKLKATLEKHGIAKQNADSFLIGLLKDKDFKKLVKANLVEEESSDEESDITDVSMAMTRSKLKEVMRNSPFKPPWVPPTLANTSGDGLPKFSELPLPEDDEDEEYRPEESICSDTMDQSFSETMDKKSELDNIPPKNIDEECVSTNPENIVNMEECGLDVASDKDLISTRTRSKHSLQSTSLDVLEAAFDPPDVTADMYDMNIGDYDWQKWLADLMKDTNGGNTQGTEDEDDPDVDPDFEFPHEIEEPDHEDLRDDFLVRVSKKELDGLLDEVENMHNDDRPPVTFPTSPKLNDSTQSSRDEQNTQPAKTEPYLPVFEISKEQAELLQQQLCQHVQLLVQSSILCRNKPDLKEYVEEAEGLLKELVDIGKSQIDKLNISSSAVMPWILPDAIELIKTNIPLSEPSVRLLRMERVKGLVSIPMAVAEVLGNSTVFMYKELLPFSAPSDKCLTQKLHFRKSEDCLLAMGMAEMADLPNMYELISEHMLPTKTEKQLRSRVKNVIYCRNQRDNFNPIRKFHSCSILPQPKKDVKFINKDTVKKPINMKGVLPNWLIALKPMLPPEDSSSEYSYSEASDFGPGVKHSTPHAKSKSLSRDQASTLKQIPAHLSLNTQCQVTPSPIRAIMVPYIPVDPQITKINSSQTKISTSPRKILPKPRDTDIAISQEISNINVKDTVSNSVLTNMSSVTGNKGNSDVVDMVDLPQATLESNAVEECVPTSKKVNIEGLASDNNIDSHQIGTFIPDVSENLQLALNEKPTIVVTKSISTAVIDKDEKLESDKSCSNEESSKPGISQSNDPTNLSSNFQSKSVSRGKSMEAMSVCEPQTASSSEEEDEKDSETEENAVATAESGDDDDISEHDEVYDNQVEEERSKPVRMKIAKTSNGFSSLPVGGYLRKVHPKFPGKKYKGSSRDLRRLRSTAKTIRTLEEDSIVQLDPCRMEKERIFAAGFHERVQVALKDHPDIFKSFTETLIKFSDGTRSPIDLYIEISNLLQDWPDLIQGFAPFLMPEQAQECGMGAEQQVYSRARKFLRQLEIQFSDDQDTMEKILNVFHTVAGTALYREEEMMQSILGLLKGYPYLQDEFITFFNDSHPPKIYYDEDFEEVDLTEELLKDPTINQFENVTLLSVPDNAPPVESNLKKPKKRRLSLSPTENEKSPSKVAALSENKENIFPDITSADADDEEDLFNTDYESEEAMTEDMQEDEACKPADDKPPPSSVPPDITVISEDALSSSPFKRITEGCQKGDVLLRPHTPTGMRLDNTRSNTFSHSPLSPLKSSHTDILSVPKTPTGKTALHIQEENAAGSGASKVDSASEGQQQMGDRIPVSNVLEVEKNTKESKTGCHGGSSKEKSSENPKETIQAASKYGGKTKTVTPVPWTREMDEILITSYQKQSTNNNMIESIAEEIKRTSSEVEDRLNHLLSLFESAETDDTSQESEEDTDILESDESSNV